MLILEGSANPVGSVVFSSDSNLLAAGSHNGLVRVWDTTGTQVLVKEMPDAGNKCAVAFSSKNDCLAVSTESQLCLLPLGEGTPTYTPHRTPGVTTDLGFVPGELLVVATGKRGIAGAGGYYIYDMTRKTIRTPVHTESHGIRALTTQPSTKTLAWVTGNNLAKWTNITKPGIPEISLGMVGSAVAIHPEGKMLAVGADWKTRLIDMPSRSHRGVLCGHKGQVVAVAFHPNGRWLATGSWDETVRIWEVSTNAELLCYQWNIGKVLCLTYSPDGTRLAAGTDRGLVAVWDVDG